MNKQVEYKIGDTVKVVSGGHITDDNDRVQVRIEGLTGEVVAIKMLDTWGYTRDGSRVHIHEPQLMVIFPEHNGAYRPWVIKPSDVVLVEK